MLEGGREKYNSGTVKDASNQTSLTYKFVQVGRDGSFIPASDDELMEVEHLLAEPRIDRDFVNGVLNFETENAWRCLTPEDFQCPVDYLQLNTNSEALDSSSIRQEREDSKFDFLNEMLQGVEDVHLQNAIEDYLLDTEFSDNVVDYALCEGPHRGGVEISKSAIPTISVPESVSYGKALDNLTMRELQGTYRSTFGRETTNKDKPWLKRHILYGLQNFAELDNVSRSLKSGISSNEKEGNLIFTCTEDTPGRVYHFARNGLANKTEGVGKGRSVGRDSSFKFCNGLGRLNSGERREKRLRKPTRRYIEESSERKSRCCSGSLEISITDSSDKLKRARSHRKGVGATTVVYRQESSIQVPFTLHVGKGREGDIKDESDERLTKGRCKSGRKIHNVWSVCEVQKLVDGVSEYGVGRWSEIKRDFFSTSDHRTSVDLKDKWRNLLRATTAQLHGKREEVEQGGKQGARLIPHSVLGRVSELAVIHPYPRDRKPKLPCSESSVVNNGKDELGFL